MSAIKKARAAGFMDTAPWIAGALVADDYIDNPTISLTAARRDGKIAAFEVEGISKACVQVR